VERIDFNNDPGTIDHLYRRRYPLENTPVFPGRFEETFVLLSLESVFILQLPNPSVQGVTRHFLGGSCSGHATPVNDGSMTSAMRFKPLKQRGPAAGIGFIWFNQHPGEDNQSTH